MYFCSPAVSIHLAVSTLDFEHLIPGSFIQVLALLSNWPAWIEINICQEYVACFTCACFTLGCLISAGAAQADGLQVDLSEGPSCLFEDPSRSISQVIEPTPSCVQVAKLPNLSMPQAISDAVSEAKSHLEAGLERCAAGDYYGAVKSGQDARRCAEVAFSHPSIMAQHNYPDQHKVAVYMPLFLPLSIPIVQVCVAELKRHVPRFLRRR